MMSLFSSFDFFYQNLFWIFILFSGFSLFFASFVMSINNIQFSLVFFNLSDFFFSLKSKSFSKAVMIFFLGFFFSIFLINFFSVFSYNFALTSQVSFVFFISLTFWSSMIFFSFFNSFKGATSHLIPEGTPLMLTIFLFMIELVSNIIRPLTLMVRLVANILAGHLLMILLAKMIFMVPPVFPLYVGLNLVEIFVSLIQSYIFSTMMVLYFAEV